MLTIHCVKCTKASEMMRRKHGSLLPRGGNGNR
jgi:hypothetical protein